MAAVRQWDPDLDPSQAAALTVAEFKDETSVCIHNYSSRGLGISLSFLDYDDG